MGVLLLLERRVRGLDGPTDARRVGGVCSAAGNGVRGLDAEARDGCGERADGGGAEEGGEGTGCA